jgi:hypothetical protein
LQPPPSQSSNQTELAIKNYIIMKFYTGPLAWLLWYLFTKLWVYSVRDVHFASVRQINTHDSTEYISHRCWVRVSSICSRKWLTNK